MSDYMEITISVLREEMAKKDQELERVRKINHDLANEIQALRLTMEIHNRTMKRGMNHVG